MTQCTAKSKRTGEQCKAQAVRGYSVCRMHGAGKPNTHTGRPIATGRYSIKRTELAAKTQEFYSDPQPGNLTSELALMRALLQNYLDRFPDDQHLPFDDIARIYGMTEGIGRLVERIAKIVAATSLTQGDIKFLQDRFTLALLTYVPDADTRVAILRFIFEDSGIRIPSNTTRFLE